MSEESSASFAEKKYEDEIDRYIKAAERALDIKDDLPDPKKAEGWDPNSMHATVIEQSYEALYDKETGSKKERPEHLAPVRAVATIRERLQKLVDLAIENNEIISDEKMAYVGELVERLNAINTEGDHFSQLRQPE